MRLLGHVSADLLAALYERAHVAIVPRRLGGGSNLKTAEALVSGRPIVATSRAFVGFEDFATAPGTRIADEPVAFWQATDAELGGAFQGPTRRRSVGRLA